ncbi:MAG: UvrD-helicase domain-containing protein [Chlorobium phaeovibrioides]|nr:UvrD-helicase domain-containing protein [Chlorobium phaeovibrioides]
MSYSVFSPTPEQEVVIKCNGAAFINACPGAGKTRIMVERAASVFENMPHGRGVAFLSFTKAAISELEKRLRQRAILPIPVYPSFIGTFDSFVWQFLIAPFGANGTETQPCLIPDIEKLSVIPFKGAQAVPLSFFDRVSGVMDQEAATRTGFNPANRKGNQIKQYEMAASRLRTNLKGRGQLSFDDARQLALERLNNPDISGRLARALSGRFIEVIVDEAQDCNRDDLRIIGWLQDSGLLVKVICDPYQSIYQFRGGVTDELFAFRKRFAKENRLQLSGNFRSTPNICKAIACLRPCDGVIQPDQALGDYKELPHAVHILSYKGKGVSSLIGSCFSELLQEHGEEISKCPVVAATWASAAKAVGKHLSNKSTAMTLRLVEAVMNFHFAPRYNQMKEAMEAVHCIILEINGVLSDISYHQYIQEQHIDPLSWRSGVINLLRDLKFDTDRFADTRAWHEHVKKQLDQHKHVSPEAAKSIGAKLKWNDAINAILSAAPSDDMAAQTIHSVKGLEFPAVCVVTTSQTLGSILDFLETGNPDDKAEEARELYVAASRAQKLLAFAVPANIADRFAALICGQGADVTVSSIEKDDGARKI